MIITQTSYDPGDDPAGVPLIGYENVISGVSATSSATGFPISNLLNSATHLYWTATSTDTQQILLTPSDTINYVGIAGHNLFDISATIDIGTTSSTIPATSLLHFEGADASTQFLDSSGNDNGWDAIGNAQIDTAQFKFGTASLLLDGTGDGLRTDGSQFAFGANDFTFECFIRRNASGVAHTIVDARSAEPSNAIFLEITSGNVLRLRVNGANVITGTNGVSTGTWLHVAVTRASGVTKLFFQGSQEGSSFNDSTVYVAGTTARLGLAFDGTEGYNGWIDEVRLINGTAVWNAAFTPTAVAYADGPTSLIGTYALLLNFDGVDASTTITDSGGNNHIFTAFNGCQLDTAQFKFGTASLLFDGTNDYLLGDGSADFAFGAGDFTIELWARWNSTAGQQVIFDCRATNGPFIALFKAGGHQISLFVDNSTVITGTTVVTAGTWHHIALTRHAGSTRIFLNGVQEGSTYSDTTNYQIGASRPVLGTNGTFTLGTSDQFNGWMDQVRVIKGRALWSTTFVPPSYPVNALSSGRGIAVDDANSILIRLSPTTSNLGLTIAGGNEAAQIAVIYAGELLVIERGIKADVQHMDIIHARRSNVLAGMSESGNFLGRVVLAEWRESQAEFAWFTPDWYRTTFEPFVESAIGEPFFFAWNPDEYPEEVAFAWIIEDIRPETDPATRRMAATISMRAIG